MFEKKILTIEEQEVLLEAVKSVLRIVLNKFQVPGHVNLKLGGLDSRYVAERKRNEVIGFELSTLTEEDVREHAEDLAKAVTSLETYDFACWVDTSFGRVRAIKYPIKDNSE